MAIVRIPKVNNYTIMSNHHLTDPNLSLKAKGLMSYMLSRPDNWDFTIEGLARQNMEGVDAIARIIREVEARGYVVRSRTRNKAGKFTDMEYSILECPRDMTNLETITEENVPVPAHDEPILDRPIPNSPLPENPIVDAPNAAAPLPENAGQINTEPLNTEIPRTKREKTELSNPDPSKTGPSIPTNYAVPMGIDRKIKTIKHPDIRKLTAQVHLQIGYHEMKEALGQSEMDTPLPPPLTLPSSACGSLHLAVATRGRSFTCENCAMPGTQVKRMRRMMRRMALWVYQGGNENLQCYKFLFFALTPRAAPVIGKILELCPRRDIVFRVAFLGIIDVPTGALIASVAQAYSALLVVLCHIDFLRSQSSIMLY